MGRPTGFGLPVLACKPGALNRSKTIFFSAGKEDERY